MRTVPRHIRGTSLVDLLVAACVIAVPLVGAVGMLVPAGRLTDSSVEQRAVSRAATALIEEVRATRFDLIDGTYSGTQRTLTDVQGASEPPIAVFSVENVPTGSTRWLVRKVTVSVSWKSVAGTQQLISSTLVCDRLANGGVPTATVPDASAATAPTLTGGGAQ